MAPKAVWLLLAAAALCGCPSPMRSDAWSAQDINGTWTMYCTWFETDGRARIKFDGNSYEAWGYTEPVNTATLSLNGPNAGQSRSLVSPILHFSGTWTQHDGNLRLDIEKAWSEPGVVGSDDDGSAKSDIQDLTNAKSLDFVLKIVNPNVVRLLSASDGPGPEGEQNIVIERNGAHSTDFLGNFNVVLNWRASFNNGLNVASSGVDASVDHTDPPPAAVEQSKLNPNDAPQQPTAAPQNPPAQPATPDNPPSQPADQGNQSSTQPPQDQSQNGQPAQNGQQGQNEQPPDGGQPSQGN